MAAIDPCPGKVSLLRCSERRPTLVNVAARGQRRIQRKLGAAGGPAKAWIRIRRLSTEACAREILLEASRIGGGAWSVRTADQFPSIKKWRHEETFMQRRHLLLGAAAAVTAGGRLAAPALSAEPKTLIHVPQASMATIDPVWTTAVVTRNAGAMIWETLYGRDEHLNARPQMVEGHTVENDGKR
ncbi:MAG TPA: hypothetical protein VGM87_21190, partial [Roseomonas sp.]